MLLPSDIARLILGYLQEEGLSATSQTFIQESPDLKEYADHATGDGTIPACVFSLFGKGLTTILNEYVAAKTKESQYEIPAMMTSLWKKLDFTLNQIKSMQNSPAISAYQRTRTRVGLANIARQRALTVASTGGGVCSTVSETSSIISPAHVANSLISHSTPVSYTAPLTRLNPGSETQLQIQDGRLLNTPKDSSVHIVVTEQRLNPGPMSPGRRKWDTPRKRGAAVGGSVGPGRTATTANSTNAEQPQPEEVIDENFPQLVIQNARDKILGDRTLQEKLAENINKILANEPVPTPSKAPSSTVEQDQSIDEILGLQGEIHMSDDAIHDILEQTESDPAFQALFDLFDCNKSKVTDGEPEEGDISSSPEEIDVAGPSATVEPLKSNDQATTQTDSSVCDATTATAKTKVGQDRKIRKSAATTLLKKTFLSSSGRASRVESCSARVLVTQSVGSQGVSSAAGNSSRKQRPASLNSSAVLTPMDIEDEPLNTPPPPTDDMDTSARGTEDCTSTATSLCESIILPSLRNSAAPTAVTGAAAEVGSEGQQAQNSTENPSTTPSLSECNRPTLSTGQAAVDTTMTPNLSDAAVTSGEGDARQIDADPSSAERELSTSASSSGTISAASTSALTSAVPSVTVTPDSLTSAAQSSSATHNSPPSSSAPVDATPHAPSFSIPSIPSKAATDSGNIVSLKIIISDNQEDSSTDTALNQAISSISGDKIPTIYLSSPAKSPVPVSCPNTPKSNMDEVAQAVSGLQNSEIFASPLTGKGGALLASPLTGTSQTQQGYIFQLPMNSTNSTLQGVGAASSWQVLLPAGVPQGQPLPINQFGGTPQSGCPGFSNGSTLILPSPVKPVMLPVSVMGQSTLGNVQMMSNQLVAIPNPVSVQQTETIPPSAGSAAAAGTEESLAGKVTPPVSAEKICEQDASKSLNHRRILCFDSSAQGQPQTANMAPPQNKPAPPSVTNASPTLSVQQADKGKTVPVPRTKPAILAGNKPKRRIEITRCPENPQTTGVFVKEVGRPMPSQPQQKDPIKKKPRKQHHTVYNQEPQSIKNSAADSSKSDNAKKSEIEKRSKSVDRKQSLSNNESKEKTSDNHTSATMSSDSAKKGTKEGSRKDAAEKAPAKPREGRTEKKSQEMPNVTANKENEIKVGAQELQQQSTPTSPSPRDFSPSATSQATSTPQSKGPKGQSKTSSLAKQAAEMLQDIQGLNSPSTPGKRPGAGTLDQSQPRTPCTGHHQEQSSDSPRTPSLQSKSKDREGTPKRLLPPNTPDVPTCSPASEAGSESSINMAAHTLMILSRAAIARTGTPLKDSLRQEEAAEKSPSSLKNSKKRKQSSAADSPPAKRESKRSPSRKKDRERKRLVDCFPHDLDVDKFLSSLHYDE